MAAETEVGHLKSKVSMDQSGFQQGFAQLNRQLKVAQSEFSVAAAKLGDFGRSSDGLKLKAEALTRQMEIQKQKVALLEAEFLKSATAKGADAKATQQLEVRLNQARLGLVSMENELKRTNTAASTMSTGLKDSATKATALFDKAKGAVVGVGLALAGAGGLFTLAQSAVDAGERVYQLAGKLHMSANEAANLNRILGMAGVNTQSFITTMVRLDKAVETAGEKGNTTTKGLKALGVSLKDSQGNLLSYSDQLKALAEGYQRATEAGWEEEYVSTVLGARGTELVPILRDYTVAAEAASRVKTIGIDPEQAHQAAISMKVLKMEVSTVGLAVSNALMPVIEDVAPKVTAAFAWMATNIKEHGGTMKLVVGTIVTVMLGLSVAAKAATWFQALHGAMVIVRGSTAAQTAATVALTAATRSQTTATETATVAQTGLNLAMKANVIVAIVSGVLALGAALYAFSKHAKDAAGGTEEFLKTVHQESDARKGNLKVLESQESSVRNLGKQYADLKAKVEKGTLSDNESLKAKEKLQELEEGLMLIIGAEGIERIKTAKNTGDACNKEIDAMQAKVTAEEDAVNAIIEKENEHTRSAIEGAKIRIAAIYTEAQAMTFLDGLRVALAGTQYGAEYGVIDPKFDQAAAMQAEREAIQSEKRAKTVAAVEKYIRELEDSLIEVNKPGGSKPPFILDPDGAEKASKAAKETKAAWEITLDALTAKFKMVQAQGEIVSLGLAGATDADKAAADLGNLNALYSAQEAIVSHLKNTYEQYLSSKDADAEETSELAVRYASESRALSDLSGKIKEAEIAIQAHAWQTDQDKAALERLNAEQTLAFETLSLTGGKVDELVLKQQQLTGRLAAQRTVTADLYRQYTATRDVLGETAEATQKAYLAWMAARTEEVKIQSDIKTTNKDLQAQADTLSTLSTEISKAAAKYQDEMTKALEDYQSKCREVNEKLIEDQEALEKSFADAVASRAASIANFVGLFEAVTREEVSGVSLIENLQGQVDTLKEWRDNLQALGARGIDENLLQSLKEMGPDAADKIAALNTLTDDQLAQYVSLWQERQREAKVAAADELKEQKAEMERKIQDLVDAANVKLQEYKAAWKETGAAIRKNAEEELQTIYNKFNTAVTDATGKGTDLILNYAAGIQSAMPQLQEKLNEVRQSILDALDPQVRHSPSIVDRVKAGVDAVFENYKDLQTGLKSIDFRASLAMLSPAGLDRAMRPSQTSNTYHYGGNTLVFHVRGSNPREIMDYIKRELHKSGVG